MATATATATEKPNQKQILLRQISATMRPSGTKAAARDVADVAAECGAGQPQNVSLHKKKCAWVNTMAGP